MSGRACKSYITKALSNIWRNGMMSFIATATIALCLLSLGVAMVLGFNISYVSSQVEGQYEIHAYIDLGYGEQEAKALRSEIECIEYVKSAEFISKEQALTDMEQSMADSSSAFQMLHGEENPLPHTFKITLTDVKMADSVVEQVSEIPGVDDVRNRSDMLQKLISTTRAAQLFAVAVMLVFAFVSVAVIANTIRLSVSARSREIVIMKYVGATDWYIRWPFVIEGAIMGIVGSTVAFLPVFFAYRGIEQWWVETIQLFNLIPSAILSNAMIIIFLLMGCMLGAFGSVLSIRKHLSV